jgi:hypothetical protein
VESYAIYALLGVTGFLASFVFLYVFKRIAELEAAMTIQKDAQQVFREAVVDRFVQKTDYKDDMREIKDTLKEILNNMHTVATAEALAQRQRKEGAHG